MAAGRVIVLNGTSSAGKSTLASTLQRRFVDQGECWIIMGVDDMFLKLPPDWIRIRDFLGAHAEEGIAFETINGEVERRVGPIGISALAAYRGSVGATARAGLNVIVDEVLLDEADWVGWQHELRGLDVLWVRVDLELDALERRERERGDRMLGLARSQYDIVHRHPAYGVHIDTHAMDPEQAADAVLAAIPR